MKLFMDKSVIKRHNFEIEKNKIQTFSNHLPSNPSFSKFEVNGGLFNWGDHKVTGQEMNGFVDKIQDRMISINGSFKSMIAAFKDVYKALDYLDKEYINGILISVEGAEKASQQALSAHEDNKKTILALQKTVQVLKDFKDSVSQDLGKLFGEIDSLREEFDNVKRSQKVVNKSYEYILNISNRLQDVKHIDEIDVIWNDVQKQQENLKCLEQNCNSNIDDIEKEIININERIKDLREFYNHLKSYKHLDNVDSMWTSLQSHSSSLDTIRNFISLLRESKHLFDIDAAWDKLQELNKELSELNINIKISIDNLNETTNNIIKDVELLKEYQLQLKSYTHLSDVDELWNNVENHKSELKKLKEQDKEINNKIDTNDKKLHDTINAMKEKYALDSIEYDKRLKRAYYIAGLSVVLTIGSIILQLTGLL